MLKILHKDYKDKVKRLLSVMLPIIGTQIAIMGMNFFDASMSGQAGDADLAGAAIGGNIWMPVQTCFAGILLAWMITYDPADVTWHSLVAFAAALAYQHGLHDLVTGVAQTDYSGYPDCRQATLQALEQALRLGMDYVVTIHTPLMFKSKAETVLLARDLGALPALADTHTCYYGQRPPCGECPACKLRAKGFAEAGIADPLIS